jgi:hypothetical protein
MSSKIKLGMSTIGPVFLTFLLFSVVAVDTSAQCTCARKRHVAHHRHSTAHRSYYTARQTYHPPRTTYITYRGPAAAGAPASYTAPPAATGRSKNFLEYDADYFDTRRIGHDFGYRDGYKRGLKVGMSRKNYYPEKNHHYKHPTNGYKSRYGSKTVYREGYRDGYLKGYHAGFWSIAARNSGGQRL